MTRVKLKEPSEEDWKNKVITMPLTQAFPAMKDVKEYRQKKCIFSHDRKHLFNVVSPRYNLINHTEAVDNVSSAIELMAEKPPEVKVLSMNNGARIIADFQSPIFGQINAAPKVDDIVDFRFRMMNSYDSAWKFSATLEGQRLVCDNGMKMPETLGGVFGKHYSFLGDPESIAKEIQACIENLPKLREELHSWHSEVMDFEKTFEQLKWLPEKWKKEVLAEADFPKKKWDLYNQLTAIASHQTKSMNSRIDMGRAICKMFFGK